MNKLHFESIDLTKSFRPLFTATVNHKQTCCLMDTGAVVAVFNKGPKLFNVWSHGVKNVTTVREVVIRGFGGEGSKAMIYNLPTFIFSDGINAIHYTNMKIAVTEPISSMYDLVLPSSMFAYMRYCIDTTKVPANIFIEPYRDYIDMSLDPVTNTVMARTQNSIDIV